MNKMMCLALGITLAGAAWAADAPEQTDAVTIAKAVLCTAVADREAADAMEAGAEFEATVDRVYFWNSAEVSQPPQTIKHVWSMDGKTMAEVSLDLKHPRTRTWSSKKVFSGAWKVEAVDGEGKVLSTVEFTVK